MTQKKAHPIQDRGSTVKDRSPAHQANHDAPTDEAWSLPPDAPERMKNIRQALSTVTDPEIPVLTVLDMGMIAGVVIQGDDVTVSMTPTFAGCPALDVIRDSIRDALVGIGEEKTTVKVVFEPPWSSDRISTEGRRKLKEFGLAPPGAACQGHAVPDLQLVPCPWCDSGNTELESLFGPTLCRSIHYCHACRQSFEHFKPL